MSAGKWICRVCDKGGWCTRNDCYRHGTCQLEQRKWSDGGGTGLVQWTGDLGPGMQVEIKSDLFTVKKHG